MTSASASAGWLSQLAPAHALPPPGWWPLAPGWWLLAALLIVAITAFAIFWLRPTQRHRHSALRELRRLADKAEIGRAHDRTPVTNAHLVCRLVVEQKNIPQEMVHQTN